MTIGVEGRRKGQPNSDRSGQAWLHLTDTRQTDRNCKSQSRSLEAPFAASDVTGQCRHSDDQRNIASPAVYFSAAPISPFQILIQQFLPLYLNARTERDRQSVVDAALRQTLQQGSLVVIRDGVVVAAPLSKARRCVRRALQAESHALLTRSKQPDSFKDLKLAMLWKHAKGPRPLRPDSITIRFISAYAALTQVDPTSKLNTSAWNGAFPREIALSHTEEFSDSPSTNRLKILSQIAAEIELSPVSSEEQGVGVCCGSRCRNPN